MLGRVAVVAGFLGPAVIAGAGVAGTGTKARATVAGRGCSRAVVEGEVRAGQGFRKTFASGLDLVLEPLASGWVVRVLPSEGKRPREDFAEIATPPYRSVSPLLLSTDFSFRAQDAVGWNPRRFRYAANLREFAALEGAYRRVAGSGSPPAADETALAGLASRQPEGVLEVLDASLAPGTADQTRAAALVSSHFGSTAHRTEQPADGGATGLGRIGWLRFRVKLDLAKGVRPASGVTAESYFCAKG